MYYSCCYDTTEKHMCFLCQVISYLRFLRQSYHLFFFFLYFGSKHDVGRHILALCFKLYICTKYAKILQEL